MKPIIMYGHPACPMVLPMQGMLKAVGADYEYINIHQDEEARERVRAINRGDESVPTFVFPDGSTLTEPSSRALSAKLQAMGYRVPLRAHITANLNLMIPIAVIVLLLLLNNGG